MSRTVSSKHAAVFQVRVQRPVWGGTYRETVYGPYATMAAAKSCVKRECYREVFDNRTHKYVGKKAYDWVIEKSPLVWETVPVRLNDEYEWEWAE